MKKEQTEEIHLQLSWVRIKRGTALKTDKIDQKWELLSPGTWNLEAGPDFLNAKFKINGQEFTGDVEIHKKTSDWKYHKHSENPLYNNVILHVVETDDCSINKSSKQKVPQIPVLTIAPASSSARIAVKDKFPSGKCQKFFSSYSDDDLHKLFMKAGIKKLINKSSKIMSAMQEQGINRALYQYIFEACGYKHNRLQFLELFSRVKSYKNLEPAALEVVLWGESGLLPDPAATMLDKEMHEFTINLWNRWWKIRQGSNSKINWTHSSIRPVNSPERRIAGLLSILKKFNEHPIEKLCHLSEKAESPNSLIKAFRTLILTSDPLWDLYYTFTSKAEKSSKVIGKSRADDIIVNCILPSLDAYSKITDNRHLKNKIKDAFLQMPKSQDNRILKTASVKWFMPPSRQKNIFKNAGSQQGAIYLYRGFCLEYCNECEKCPLNTLIKNL
jgi:hypothetical protein